MQFTDQIWEWMWNESMLRWYPITDIISEQSSLSEGWLAGWDVGCLEEMIWVAGLSDVKVVNERKRSWYTENLPCAWAVSCLMLVCISSSGAAAPTSSSGYDVQYDE